MQKCQIVKNHKRFGHSPSSNLTLLHISMPSVLFVLFIFIMFLMPISRLRFKQSRISMLIPHIYVLGCFVNFLVIFRYIWREIVFLKGLVKLMEIGNLEDLLLF